jgi:GTPase SAR1 family protein
MITTLVALQNNSLQRNSAFDLPHRENSHVPLLADGSNSIELIAHGMKTLIKKIRDLRHLGIEDSKIALPKICVVGDQSTGKSSLIEGMSEIKVPRSAGTCTRCPLEINLSESEADQPWTCQISLCLNYMFDGQRKIKKLPKKSHSLGPWVEQDQVKVDFITLTDKEKVQEALRCAQLAILNPTDDPAAYHPSCIPDIHANTKVKFSPNVIRLDISAPFFPNLSFYDLPGVISQTEFAEESYLVTLVENLVKQYISQENCTVLLTLPMTDDATNSSAARIVRDIPRATKRTLGVLTKPDRVEVLHQWTEILDGDKFALGHGYYVVRNNPDPSVGHAQARLEEGQFFASPPWTTDLAAFQTRFGTRNLQAALSRLLQEQIQSCLPIIVRQINEKAEQIDNELLTLPEPPSQKLPYILWSKLRDIKERMRAHIDGGSRDYPMQKIWTHIAKDFEAAITRTRPTMKVISETETFAPQPEVDGDPDCELTVIRSTVKRKSPGDAKPPIDSKPRPNQAQSDFTAHFDAYRRKCQG